MKRILLLLTLLLLALSFSNHSASGQAQRRATATPTPTPTAIANPHGNYSASTTWCLKCHNVHAAQQPSPNALCQQCHEDLQIHMEASCADCHDPHGVTKQAALLRGETRMLCAECHDDKVEPSDQQVVAHFQHEDLPDCATCHEPHQASMRGMEVTEACAGCHTDVMPSATTLAAIPPVVHEPLREEGCPACHDFHAVKQDRPLAVAVNTLCLDCHSDLEHDAHPVSGRRDIWHGGLLSCVSCHAPHDSPYQAELLLAGDALCLQCHKFQG